VVLDRRRREEVKWNGSPIQPFMQGARVPVTRPLQSEGKPEEVEAVWLAPGLDLAHAWAVVLSADTSCSCRGRLAVLTPEWPKLELPGEILTWKFPQSQLAFKEF
jgi:hypothetical protein